MDLLTNAHDDCDTSNATQIGSVTILVNREVSLDPLLFLRLELASQPASPHISHRPRLLWHMFLYQDVTVDFNLDPALKYTLRETHLYAGLDRLPPSASSFPNHHEFPAGGEARVQDSFTVNDFDLGDNVHVVAEAKICRAPPKVSLYDP